MFSVPSSTHPWSFYGWSVDWRELNHFPSMIVLQPMLMYLELILICLILGFTAPCGNACNIAYSPILRNLSFLGKVLIWNYTTIHIVLAQSACLVCVTHPIAWSFSCKVWHSRRHWVLAYIIHSLVTSSSLHMPWHQNLTFELPNMPRTLAQKVSDVLFQILSCNGTLWLVSWKLLYKPIVHHQI